MNIIMEEKDANEMGKVQVAENADMQEDMHVSENSVQDGAYDEEEH